MKNLANKNLSFLNFFSMIISFLIITSCDNKPIITSMFNSNRNISTVYYTELDKKIDSLVFDSYYGKDSISIFSENIWKYTYLERCGTGCSSRKTAFLSIYRNRLINNLLFESYYKEFELGDATFKKNYIRKTEIIKKENGFFLKRTCLRNDVEFYSKTEKIFFDQDKHLFYNNKFNFEGKEYYGVSIDSSEYIYYKGKWFDFDSRVSKVYQ